MAAPGAEFLILRIAVGAGLGGVIGYERDRHGRPVGLRTHVIVALAASTFMVVSAFFRYFQEYAPGDGVDVDASRIAASVVSGIGFLATGAILRTGLTIQGLTTAAGLWLVTAIGLAAGAGMFIVATTVTVMGFLVLTVMRKLEDKTDHVTRHHIQVVVADDATGLIGAVAELGGTVGKTHYERTLDHERTISLAFDLTLPSEVPTERLVSMLEARPGIRRVSVSTSA